MPGSPRLSKTSLILAHIFSIFSSLSVCIRLVKALCRSCACHKRLVTGPCLVAARRRVGSSETFRQSAGIAKMFAGIAGIAGIAENSQILDSLVDGADLRTFLRPPANIPVFWF